MPGWLKSLWEDILKGIRAYITVKVVAVMVTLFGVGALTIRAVWQSILSGHSEGLRLSVFGVLVCLNLLCLWLEFRIVPVGIRPVSGTNPQALLDVENCGRAAEFHAGARVLDVRMESGEVCDFQDRTLSPPWLSSGASEPIHLGKDQSASLLLATSSSSPMVGRGIPRGVEWFRVKLEDAGDHGEVFPWITKEKIEIRIRVTVTRKKMPKEFRQPRSFVREFLITGHPDWDLSVANATSRKFHNYQKRKGADAQGGGDQ